MKQIRKLTREFQGVVNDMIRESDLDDLRKEAQDLRKSIDPTSEIREAMQEVEDDVRETSKSVNPKDLWQPEPAPIKPAAESKPAPAPKSEASS